MAILPNPGPALTADVFKQLSWPDRLLPFLIIGAMILGVVLGYYTDIGEKLDTVKVTTVSLPIAVGEVFWGCFAGNLAFHLHGLNVGQNHGHRYQPCLWRVRTSRDASSVPLVV